MARFPVIAARNRATAVSWAGSKLGQPGRAASGPVIHMADVLARGSLRWPKPDQPGFGSSGR
ncbi:hypothetical protein CXZ05_15320 [Arthrobacter sp. AFG20]|nr:hypothetical protein CXZ05_15320 [Arthrobacter sp. AFG20]